MINTYIPDGNPRPSFKVIPNIVYSQLLSDPTVNQDAVIPMLKRDTPLTLTLLKPEEARIIPGDNEGEHPGERNGEHDGPPPMPGGNRKLPCIVNVEGGGFNLFQKDQQLANLTYLCEAGFAVACLDYRKASEAHFPAPIRDIKAAIRFLRAHAADFELDPDRFAIIGESAGGHLSAFIGCSGETLEFDTGENLEQSSAVQAACDMYGPINFLTMDNDPNHSYFVDHNDIRSAESQWLGAALPDIPDTVKKANPCTYVSANTPPILILHGDKDGNVGYTQSVELHDALVAAGNDKVEMWRVPGAGHGGDPFREPKMLKIITDFFQRAFDAVK